MHTTIYKICPETLWREAEAAGRFDGAPVDRADGFIHFSTPSRSAETAARHFAGQDDLLLIAVDAAALGAALKYESSRGGALFPHLYAPLPLSAVKWAKPLPLGHRRAPCLPGDGCMMRRSNGSAGGRCSPSIPRRRTGLSIAALKTGLPLGPSSQPDARLEGHASPASTSPIRSAWRPATTRMPKCRTRCWARLRLRRGRHGDAAAAAGQPEAAHLPAYRRPARSSTGSASTMKGMMRCHERLRARAGTAWHRRRQYRRQQGQRRSRRRLCGRACGASRMSRPI